MWLAPHFAANSNRLRFDRFMELALHHPGHGYYSQHAVVGGPRGDFSTSATLSELLATAIADWIGTGQPAHVIEIGAGSGQLAHAIVRRLHGRLRSRLLPQSLRSPRYHIVERSPTLRQAQRLLLGGTVRWHDSVEAALNAAGGVAFLFSNELVDAFPVRIFRAGPPWEELHLALHEGSFHECWVECPEHPASSVFTRRWPGGQRVEVHESYHHWWREWIPAWTAGELLTIDYGGSPDAIYYRRPEGSLRGYFRQQRITGPELYALPGRRDLTADVNFDDLVRIGEECGLGTLSIQTQREFLLPHLGSAPPNHADQFLVQPGGPGDAFHMLRQRRS